MKKPINEENIPAAARLRAMDEDKEGLRRILRQSKDVEEKRIARRLLQAKENRNDPPPVELEAANAEILERFIEQARNERPIDRDALEFVCQLVEEALVGRAVNSVCTLPGRNEKRKPGERAMEIAKWMSYNLKNMRFSTDYEAADFAAELWSVSSSTARKYYYNFTNQNEGESSIPKKLSLGTDHTPG